MRERNIRAGRGFLVAAGIALALQCAPAGRAAAHHIPDHIDVPRPWAPLPEDGYLDFMTPERPIRLQALPGTVATGTAGLYREEHTGRTAATGEGASDHPFDNDTTAGDRADFDWVQEHRPDETGTGRGGTNHPGPGAIAWTIGVASTSAHRSGGEPHGHSSAEAPPGPLPELSGEGYRGETFNVVDVFSVIDTREDRDQGGPREAALDYDLWFADLERGVSAHGVPTVVFVPGWTGASAIDDYVVRWVPAFPGEWNAVVIDPPFGHGHDQVTEIDAVRAASGTELSVSAPVPAPLLVLDGDHLVGLGAARGGHLDGFADILADQGAGQR